MSLFKNEHSDDPKTKLRRRARQRLIGAIILVLTAVIVIPMLLDTEPRPLGQDIAVTIPSRTTPFVPKLEPSQPVVPAVAPESAPVPVAAAPESKSVAAPEVAKPEEKRVEATKPEPVKPEVPKPEVPKPEAAKPEAAKPDVAKQNSKHEPKVAATTEKSPDAEAAKALAALEGRESKAPLKLFVQVGAFSNEEKVKELQANLRAAGVETFTEKLKVSSGVRLRVRAGPFGSRAEAEQTLAKVSAAGVAGALVVPQ